MRHTITLPDAVADHVRGLAAHTGQSVSAVVAEAVERHVAEARRRHALGSIDALLGTGSGEPAEFDRALADLRRDDAERL